MSISQIAARRIAEDRAAEDASYRRQLERRGRPLSSHARAMSDEELVAKLRSLEIDIDPARLDELSQKHAAAYELAEAFTDQVDFDASNFNEDWAWFAIECLWERWLPQRPSLEMVDDRMQAGYAALGKNDSADACRQWKQAWNMILDLIERFKIETIADIDERFGLTQCVFNWVQDYESELHNAGLDDSQFLHDRVTLCQTVIERFDEGRLTTNNFRSALAESHFYLGQGEIGDRLFRQWLDDDPRWGWGWIGWSDCHYLFAPFERDAARAIQILNQGLDVPEVRDRKDILSRLEDVLAEIGREEEAPGIRQQRQQTGDKDSNPSVQERSMRVEGSGRTMRLTENFDFGEDGLPVERLEEFTETLRSDSPDLPDNAADSYSGTGPRVSATGLSRRSRRVGRNDPCPCGSGKKFKKCCGSAGT